MRYFTAILWLLLATLTLTAQAAEQFGATAVFTPEAESWIAAVLITGPPNGYVAAEILAPEPPDGASLAPLELPAPKADELFEGGVFPVGTTLRYRLSPKVAAPAITLTLQGCDDGICYLPKKFVLTPEPAPPADTAVTALREYRTLEGYANAEDFTAWLDNTAPETDNILQRIFVKHGLFWALLLLLPLGMLLNLTPCVLPMVPINLGIIGAGAASGSRARGCALGATYGAAMALAYGTVGAIVVRLGGKWRFGAVNSSPWFNFAIAAIFVALALAMLDLFFVDFSRYRNSTKIRNAGAFGTAALLGAMTALLAGACIAPVLIWVLILAMQLYSEGNHAGLLMPLMLGIGLGLPWPILGAGVACLPKPGAWMNRVKQLFAIIMLFVAGYFAWIGCRLITPANAETDARWKTNYQEAYAAAAEKKPLLIDFWGISCKACTLMDNSTLKNPEVIKRLDQIVCVKIQADDTTLPEISELVAKYGIVGLPTYVLIEPGASGN